MRTASAAGASLVFVEPAGAQEVQQRVVAGREAIADLGLEWLELGVHAVAAETAHRSTRSAATVGEKHGSSTITSGTEQR